MNPIKVILVGILLVGVLMLGVGVYAVFIKSDDPQAVNKTINSTPQVANPSSTPNTSKIELKAKTLNVPMSQPWIDSGLEIGNGQNLTITATGRGVWKNISKNNPNATPNAYEECSPEGTSPNSDNYWSNIHQYQIRANKGALIGKIGENGLPFKVGSNFNQKVNQSGSLYLGVNDMKQEIDYSSYYDNTGGFQANITIK